MYSYGLRSPGSFSEALYRLLDALLKASSVITITSASVELANDLSRLSWLPSYRVRPRFSLP